MRATRLLRSLLGGLALLAVLVTPASARADAVTDWNQVAAAALQSPGTATPPGAGQGAVSTAHLAMVHAAVYDAVTRSSAATALRLLARGQALVLAGRRRRGRRASRARHGGSGSRRRMPGIEAATSGAPADPGRTAKAGGIATG